MKFVIVSPKQTSGGSIALHALCKYLSDAGQDARIFYLPLNLDEDGVNHFSWKIWFPYTVINTFRRAIVRLFGERRFQNNERFKGLVNQSVKHCKTKYTPFIGKNTIVVYPESLFGNPLHATKVVRWLLYFNRFEGEEDTAYGENDLFVCYRPVFNDPHLNPDEHTLHVCYFDLDLYRNWNEANRSGRCYVIRKGRDRKDLPEEFDGPIIDDMLEADKVRVLNESEQCVCYDTQTAYAEIAALCGCLSVVVPEDNRTRADYVSEGELYPGVAYGFSDEELNFARDTQGQVLDDFLASDQESKEHVARFIKLCKEYFFGSQD